MIKARWTLSDDEKAQLLSIDLSSFSLAVVRVGYVLADGKIAGFVARTLTSRYLWVRMDGTCLEFESDLDRAMLIEVIQNNTGAKEVFVGGQWTPRNLSYRRR